jgi:hypothetical protein
MAYPRLHPGGAHPIAYVILSLPVSGYCRTFEPEFHVKIIIYAVNLSELIAADEKKPDDILNGGEPKAECNRTCCDLQVRDYFLYTVFNLHY